MIIMEAGYTMDIEKCLEILQRGGLILYPTDTIWGIGCDATNEDAVAKIYHLKKRSHDKSMIVLVAEVRDILIYITQPDPRIVDYMTEIKKPTTVIYDGAVGLAGNLISKDGTVAIRIVKDSFCKHLIRRFGKPIVSTSANLSGYPSPSVFGEIDLRIKNAVDYIVKYRQDDPSPSVSSSIVRFKKDGSVEIIRP